MPYSSSSQICLLHLGCCGKFTGDVPDGTLMAEPKAFLCSALLDHSRSQNDPRRWHLGELGRRCYCD